MTQHIATKSKIIYKSIKNICLIGALLICGASLQNLSAQSTQTTKDTKLKTSDQTSLKDALQNYFNALVPKDADPKNTIQCKGNDLFFTCKADSIQFKEVWLRHFELNVKALKNHIRAKTKAKINYKQEFIDMLPTQWQNLLPESIHYEQQYKQHKATIATQEELQIQSPDDSKLKIEYEFEANNIEIKDKTLIQNISNVLALLVANKYFEEAFLEEAPYDTDNKYDEYHEDCDSKDCDELALQYSIISQFSQQLSQTKFKLKKLRITLESKTLRDVLLQTYLEEWQPYKEKNKNKYGFSSEILEGISFVKAFLSPKLTNNKQALESVLDDVAQFLLTDKNDKIGFELKATKNSKSITLEEFNLLDDDKLFLLLDTYELKTIK
ncbi:hypothetical protein [Helicobacter fennelliae]|uniref:Periplasmic protein n=2 Tax=Helicobacter TaxID=209 RepID=T1CR08_9HELI|nr:hypothetical protein [Helicobacter fennelliae]GAD19184.1 hypothetical protein HFN_0315 [Helicobacter fennelliae MRY12-0050]STP08258.1 Uncharacterised protein [Helicobacter fennelliae]STQ84668.1 Uncharacterised protein [Helicobacter fennelliae]